MTKVPQRRLSYGEIKLNKRLARYEVWQQKKRDASGVPNRGTSYTVSRPSKGAYGELAWAPDNC